MTNKEKYKQAFDTLSTSDNFSLEVDKMSILKMCIRDSNQVVTK